MMDQTVGAARRKCPAQTAKSLPHLLLLGAVLVLGVSCRSNPESAAIAPQAKASPASPEPTPQTMTKIVKTDEEWKQMLTPEQFQVTRRKGTERAFTGAYWNSKEDGTYACICCGNELFKSDTKYDSGTGWPSYWAPISDDRVHTEEDNSLFMRRIEVLCSRCDAHLGHVFEDGPKPTGLRYCINSASLKFIKKQ